MQVDAGGGEHLRVDLALDRRVREARDSASANASSEGEQMLRFGVLLRGLLCGTRRPGHDPLA